MSSENIIHEHNSAKFCLPFWLTCQMYKQLKKAAILQLWARWQQYISRNSYISVESVSGSGRASVSSGASSRRLYALT